MVTSSSGTSKQRRGGRARGIWRVRFVHRVGEGRILLEGSLDGRHSDSRGHGDRGCTPHTASSSIQRKEKALWWVGLCTVAMGYKCTVQLFLFPFLFLFFVLATVLHFIFGPNEFCCI